MADLILSGGKRIEFPRRLGTKKDIQISPLLFNIALKVPATAVREEKEIREI